MYVIALFLPFLYVTVFSQTYEFIYVCLVTVGFMLLYKCLIYKKKKKWVKLIKNPNRSCILSINFEQVFPQTHIEAIQYI